jgi:hypothetical protein
MVSVVEVMRTYLESDGDLTQAAPGGIRVGPCSFDEQQSGCIGLMLAGRAELDTGLPLRRFRIEARCLAPELGQSETICRELERVIDSGNRVVVRQPSDGQKYLVHFMTVNGGPSCRKDSDAPTWETLLFVEVLCGTEGM